jgi:hypothetical protein
MVVASDFYEMDWWPDALHIRLPTPLRLKQQGMVFLVKTTHTATYNMVPNYNSSLPCFCWCADRASQHHPGFIGADIRQAETAFIGSAGRVGWTANPESRQRGPRPSLRKQQKHHHTNIFKFITITQ